MTIIIEEGYPPSDEVLYREEYNKLLETYMIAGSLGTVPSFESWAKQKKHQSRWEKI